MIWVLVASRLKEHFGDRLAAGIDDRQQPASVTSHTGTFVVGESTEDRDRRLKLAAWAIGLLIHAAHGRKADSVLFREERQDLDSGEMGCSRVAEGLDEAKSNGRAELCRMWPLRSRTFLVGIVEPIEQVFPLAAAASGLTGVECLRRLRGRREVVDLDLAGIAECVKKSQERLRGVGADSPECHRGGVRTVTSYL